jgi:hypothetical protein
VRRPGWLLAGIALVVAVAYVPALGAGFLGDDLEGIWRAGHFDPGTSGLGYPANHWRATADLTFVVNERLWGLNAVAFHATNLALHLVATLSVGVAAVALPRYIHGHDKPGAPWTPMETSAGIAAVLLFGLLPSHSEAVVWIAGRGDVAMTVLVVGALLCHVGNNSTSSARGPVTLVFAVASWALYGAALGAKESAVALVGLVALVDFARARGATPVRLRSAVVAALPFAMITGSWLLFRQWRLGSVLGGFARITETTSPVDAVRRTLTVALRSLLPSAPRPVWVMVVVSVAALSALLMLARPGSGALKVTSTMAGCLMVAVLPAGILGVSLTSTAGERLAYLPSVFAVIGVTHLWASWRLRSPTRALAVAASVTVTCVLLLFSVQQRWVAAGEAAAAVVAQMEQLPVDQPVLILDVADTRDGVEFLRNALWPAAVLFHGWTNPAALQQVHRQDLGRYPPGVPRWGLEGDRLIPLDR